jgi:hypothetical protein
MTVNTVPIIDIGMKIWPHGGQFCIMNLLGMATNTIVLNSILSGLFDGYNLRFQAEGKHIGVAQAIHGFKVIVIDYVVLGNMTIVTGSYLTVSAVAPGGVLRRHYMAVYAGFGAIRQIGRHFGQMDNK